MAELKRQIARVVPRDLRYRLKRYLLHPRAASNYTYDRKRFLAGSSSVNAPDDREQLTALITLNYHKLEKGLALPQPRPGFGLPVVRLLIAYARDYLARFGRDGLIDTVGKVLGEYRSFSGEHGIRVEEVERFLADAKDSEGEGEGGTIAVSRDDLWAAGKMDLRAFFASRYSIRNFTGEPVSVSDLEAGVEMAQKTPSVCNRQCGRVHYVTDKEDIVRLLSFQNGNRGYGDQAGAVLLITADMRAFTMLGERNQAWIDGGLFAMSLNYALHSLGLGACMLNWSVEKGQDEALRAAFAIPEQEVVIMMMAVGHMPERLRVARSPRRPLKSVLSPLAHR